MSTSAELDHALKDLSDCCKPPLERVGDAEEYSYDLPVFGVGLKLHGVDSRVVLLCTPVCCGGAPPSDTEEEEALEVDGAALKELEVTKVLFETPPSLSGKHVMIFQCARAGGARNFCLKLMDSNDIYQSEKRAYERMMAREGEGAASDLFLRVHFFCEVILPDKRVWKGYCMEEGKYSLRDIFYPPCSDPISGALEQNKIFADILRDKERAMAPRAAALFYSCAASPKHQAYVWEEGEQGIEV